MGLGHPQHSRRARGIDQRVKLSEHQVVDIRRGFG